MQFTKGESLTTKELIKRLKISKNTWYSNKDTILAGLSQALDYSVQKKGSSVIYIIESDGDYECNRKRCEKAKEKDKVFEDAIMTTLIAQPLNTAANVARIIKKDNTQIAELNYADSTLCEYIRNCIKDWFGTEIEEPNPLNEKPENRKGYIAQKVWCLFDEQYSIYTPMPQSQVEEFINITNQYIGTTESTEIKLLADYSAGSITKEEFASALGELKHLEYTNAKKQFKDKYGYYPIKVPKYLVYGYYEPTATQIQGEINDRN